MREWYRSLSNPVKAAIATALFTFASTAGMAVIGLLAKIQEWANGGEPVDVSDISIVGKLIVSAAVSAAAGLLNFIVRRIQLNQDPSAGPHYPT